MFKRKAVESSQSAADLKLHLDKYHSQLKEAQATVTDKTGALQQETFKYKRKQVWLRGFLFSLCCNNYFSLKINVIEGSFF